MLQQCNAQYLLVGPEQIDLGERIQAELEISTLTIEGQVQIDVLPPTAAYALTPTMAVSEDYPSILFFTSGTTGPPKGVLHARKTINKYARMAEAGLNDDICLIPSGAFWSVYFTKVFQMLLTGVRIEIQNFGRQYNLIWERFRAKTATKIVLSPTFWYGMMHYFQQNISQLPEPEVQEYVEGARHLRDATATGAMPSKRLKEFWRDVRGGRALKVLYGSTETQEISVCDGEVEFTEVRRTVVGRRPTDERHTERPRNTSTRCRGQGRWLRRRTSCQDAVFVSWVCPFCAPGEKQSLTSSQLPEQTGRFSGAFRLRRVFQDGRCRYLSR